MNKRIVAVDFDGTIVEHKYPSIGKELPGAIDTLKELISNGHKLILLTMRSDNYLDQAIQFLKDRGIEFWAINSNPDQIHWTNSNKVYANLYIDDTALGCPLIEPDDERPHVDWKKVRKILKEKELI